MYVFTMFRLLETSIADPDPDLKLKKKNNLAQIFKLIMLSNKTRFFYKRTKISECFLQICRSCHKETYPMKKMYLFTKLSLRSIPIGGTLDVTVLVHARLTGRVR